MKRIVPFIIFLAMTVLMTACSPGSIAVMPTKAPSGVAQIVFPELTMATSPDTPTDADDIPMEEESPSDAEIELAQAEGS